MRRPTAAMANRVVPRVMARPYGDGFFVPRRTANTGWQAETTFDYGDTP